MFQRLQTASSGAEVIVVLAIIALEPTRADAQNEATRPVVTMRFFRE